MSPCICFFLIAVLLSRQAPCGLDAALIVVVIWLISHVRLFCNLMDCSLPGSSVHGIFQGRNTGVGCHFLLQGIFQPRNQTHIPCMGRQIPYHWVTWGTLLSYYTYFIFHWCWLGQCLTHIRCSQNVCWKNCESMFIVICHCPLPQLTLGKLLQSPFTVPIHGYFQPRKQL